MNRLSLINAVGWSFLWKCGEPEIFIRYEIDGLRHYSLWKYGEPEIFIRYEIDGLRHYSL